MLLEQSPIRMRHVADTDLPQILNDQNNNSRTIHGLFVRKEKNEFKVVSFLIIDYEARMLLERSPIRMRDVADTDLPQILNDQNNNS